MFSHSPFSLSGLPPGVKILLGVNIGVFILQQFLPQFMNSTLGLVPVKVWSRLHVWQPFTYMFLHGSFLHLLFNMFFGLWMFGKEIENSWGTKEFLKFYFICGVGAGLFNTMFEPMSTIPIVGASGAIYGILVAFAMIFPDTVIYVWMILPMKAKHFVILIGVLEFISSVQGAPTMIARLAHLGGMVTGYFYIKSYEFQSFINKVIGKIHDIFIVRKLRVIRPDDPPTKDELVKEVDRILEKVLIHGVDSLSQKERDIMRRYSSRKH